MAKQYGVDYRVVMGKENQDKYQPTVEEPTIGERDSTQQQNQAEINKNQFKPKTDEVKPFGYELFAGEPTTFMPSETAVVPDTYLVGRGDQLLMLTFMVKKAIALK